MELKEIALAAAMETDEYLATKIAAPESWGEIRDQELCKRFLTAVDAERGKDAVRYCYECGSIGETGEGFIDCCPDGLHAQYVHREIADQAAEGFLSPTIPPNMVPVPVEPTKEIRIAIWDALTEQRPSLDGVWEKLIQAAGVTK